MTFEGAIVYVISYIDGSNDSHEPVVTVFDNERAASSCYRKFKLSDSTDKKCVSLDKCPVYSSFYDGGGD